MDSPPYHVAFNKEYAGKSFPDLNVCNTIKLNGDMNNNKMERINGEVRDREKTMRGLKKKDTPMLKKRDEVYHNFIKPHEGLKGKTPLSHVESYVEGITNG